MKAIERLYKYIDFIGIKAIPFEKKVGLSNGYLGKQLTRNADLGEGILIKIIENCPEINPEWLLTGNGEMLKSGVSQPPEIAVSGGLLQEKITFLQEKVLLLQENGLLKDKVIALNDKVIDGLEFKVNTLEKQLIQDKSTTIVATTKSKRLVAATV